MKADLVRLCAALLGLVACAAAQDLAPTLLGAKPPLLLLFGCLAGIPTAIGAGLFTDALGALPFGCSALFFLAVALFVRLMRPAALVVVMFAAGLYQLWVALWGDAALGAVYGIVSGSETTTVAQTDVTVLYFVNPLRISHLKNGFMPPPRARVVTSGMGGVFPKGLVVGYMISDVRDDESKLEREADLAPAVDFPALEEVFIRRES